MATPDYYKRAGHECRELSRCFNHPMACAVEYVWRHKGKNGVEDLRKALDWIEWDKNQSEDSDDGMIDTFYEILDNLENETTGPEQWFWHSIRKFDWDAAETALRELIKQEQ